MQKEEFTHKVMVHKHKMYRFAYSYMHNEDEAKDIVQDVLLKLWENRLDLNEKESIEAWCMTMVRNKSLDKIKRVGRKMKTSLNGSHLSLVSSNPSPSGVVMARQTMESIQDILKALPEKQKSAFVLRDMEGYSYLEISDMMQVDMSQVKVNIFRARKEIKKRLENLEEYGQKQN